jgi:ATP-dependent DNA helicase
MDEKDNKEGVSDAMQAEEERMRAQREKNDAKREAQLEKERQDDIKSGKDVLDKKFQQLEFLMNKSKVSIVEHTRDAYWRHTGQPLRACVSFC